MVANIYLYYYSHQKIFRNNGKNTFCEEWNLAKKELTLPSNWMFWIPRCALITPHLNICQCIIIDQQRAGCFPLQILLHWPHQHPTDFGTLRGLKFFAAPALHPFEKVFDSVSRECSTQEEHSKETNSYLSKNFEREDTLECGKIVCWIQLNGWKQY